VKHRKPKGHQEIPGGRKNEPEANTPANAEGGSVAVESEKGFGG